MTQPNPLSPGQPGQKPAEPPPEQEVWRGRPSPKAGWGYLIIAGIVTLGLVILAGWPRFRWLWPVSAAGSAGAWVWALLCCFWPAWGIAYRLTTQRLFIRRGVFSQVTDQTELFRVDDVEVRQDVLAARVRPGRREGAGHGPD